MNTNHHTEVEDVGWPDVQQGRAPDAARRGRATRKELVAGLEARGHEVSIGQQNSGLHVVRFTAAGLEGGVDPRREGVVAGPPAIGPGEAPQADPAE